MIWKQKVAKGEPRLTFAANYVTEEEHAPQSSYDPAPPRTKAAASWVLKVVTPPFSLAMAPRSGEVLLPTVTASAAREWWWICRKRSENLFQ